MTSTKELILAGGQPRPFTISTPEGDFEVLIRPLASSEIGEVQAAQVSGIKLPQLLLEQLMDQGATNRGQRRGQALPRPQPRAERNPADDPTGGMAMGDTVAGQKRAEFLAAVYGLVEPAFTLEELEEVRTPGFVEQVGQEVMRRSGLGQSIQAQIDSFRSERGGADAAGDSSLGEPVGADDR